jgi:hypothetical protein
MDLQNRAQAGRSRGGTDPPAHGQLSRSEGRQSRFDACIHIIRRKPGAKDIVAERGWKVADKPEHIRAVMQLYSRRTTQPPPKVEHIGLDGPDELRRG